MNKKIIIGIIILAVIGCIIGIIAFVTNKNNYKKEDYISSSNGACADGIGGQCYDDNGNGFTKTSCMSWAANAKQYQNQHLIIDDEIKEKLVFQKGNTCDNFYSDKLLAACKPWIEDPSKKQIDVKCLEAIWEDTGCNPTDIETSSDNQNYTFKQAYLDNQYWLVKGCGTAGIKTKKSKKFVEDTENDLNKSMQLSMYKYGTGTGTGTGPGPIQNAAIQNMMALDKKGVDKSRSGSEKIKDSYTDGTTDTKKSPEETKEYLNYNLYLLEIAGGYNKALNSGIDKNTAGDALADMYNSFKNDGTVENIIGEQNVSAFEQAILDHTGVDVNKERYQRGGGGSYICTAVKKTQKSVSDEDYQTITKFGKWAVQQPEYTKGLGLYFGAMRHLMPVISHMEHDNEVFWDDLTDFFNECVDGVKSRDYDRVIHLFTVKSIHLAEEYFGGISHLKGVVPDDEYNVLQNIYDDRKKYVEKYVLANN